MLGISHNEHFRLRVRGVKIDELQSVLDKYSDDIVVDRKRTRTCSGNYGVCHNIVYTIVYCRIVNHKSFTPFCRELDAMKTNVTLTLMDW